VVRVEVTAPARGPILSIVPEYRDPDDEALDRFWSQGWTVIPDVLSDTEVEAARTALVDAAAASEASGMPVRLEALDPGGRNIRVYDLVAHARVFADLAEHPAVLPSIEALLGDDVILSNFTANTALPGSGSMNAHCDQSTVMPEPWTDTWAMNAIWCLHDTDEENGATRYLPGSHEFTSFDQVPDDPKAGMKSFAASVGSVILMHGRLWHTSGENRSADRDRALLFAFYTAGFLRPQTNWWRTLSDEVVEQLSPRMKALCSLDFGNLGHGGYLADWTR
jgi:ectoine hydroxylase-related dioxygenase (phytanoyl-CoA dioxygenase family)